MYPVCGCWWCVSQKEGLTVVIVDGKGNVLSTAKQHESVHQALAEARVKSGYAPPMEVDQHHPLPPLPPPPGGARSGGSGYQHGEAGQLAPLITPSSSDVAHTSTKQVVYQVGQQTQAASCIGYLFMFSHSLGRIRPSIVRPLACLSGCWRSPVAQLSPPHSLDASI